MASKPLSRRRARAALTGAAAGATVLAALAAAGPAGATPNKLVPGSLIVSSSVYHAADITPGQTLPVGCTPTSNYGGVSCGYASADGTYPTVFNNALTDSNFGVTSPIRLDDLTTDGAMLGSIQIPPGQMVTSFSSKSELALNFSPDGQDLTFMGYQAPQDAIDVSNSNTPGVVDPSNPVPQSYYREVADMTSAGKLSYTQTNAYSGNNGRAAILDGGNYYTAGNAGNGNSPEPAGVILGAGDSLVTPGATPGQPDPYGSFNVTEMGNSKADPPDKIGKDTNFRGLTISNNVVYLTKGSGGNGIDTVYYVDTVGGTCPKGVGIPAAGAPLPQGIDTSNLSTASLQASGVTPYNMCVLKGFPTNSQKAKSPYTVPPNHPFGIWFANPTTLYVADEGDGSPVYDTTSNTYTDATPAGGNIGGLEKWTFNGTQWVEDYTLQNGLNLGTPYTVPGYPTGDNSATGLPWAPAADGLRDITGTVNGDGTATIYAETSTVSGSGDQGADPNQIVKVTDNLAAATLPDESFTTVKTAAAGQVLRGVAIVPSGF